MIKAIISISGCAGIKCEAETLQVLIARVNEYISDLPEDCEVEVVFSGAGAELEDDLK